MTRWCCASCWVCVPPPNSRCGNTPWASPTMPALVTPTPWDTLKNFTDARIALGRAGVSLPTLRQHSQATDRTLYLYLQRPDLGRRLDTASLQALAQWQNQQGDTPGFDLAFVLVDGLSALAIHQNAVALVSLMLRRLQTDTRQPWTVVPLTVVAQSRVAIGDEVGAALRANTVVVLSGTVAAGCHRGGRQALRRLSERTLIWRRGFSSVRPGFRSTAPCQCQHRCRHTPWSACHACGLTRLVTFH